MLKTPEGANAPDCPPSGRLCIGLPCKGGGSEEPIMILGPGLSSDPSFVQIITSIFYIFEKCFIIN